MKWEFDILYALQKIHQPVLDHIMTGLSTIGNAGIFWIVLGLALCIPKKYRKIGIQMVISMAITFIIGNLILKNLIARPRPCWLDTQIALLIKSPKDYSFPSGHSMNGFAASIALSQRVLKGGDKERDDYLSFLKSGGSRYPIDALKVAGVDMSKSDAVKATAAYFDSLITELENLIS